MLLRYTNKLKGTFILTDDCQQEKSLQSERLYKFIWVRKGHVTVEIDDQTITLNENEVISLTHLQHLLFKEVQGQYLTLMFNCNFYCIYENDKEVSCSGFLFKGSSEPVRITITPDESHALTSILDILERQFAVADSLQEETLRTMLKAFIIQCTRIAFQQLNVTEEEKATNFDIVRQYYNLVDEHYRNKKQVQDYADMMHKTPKTLSRLFAIYKQPTPLKVIHERIETEAKRLLLYSNKSVKEIADTLGFEDQATFSRFFKNTTGQSAVQFRGNGVENEKRAVG
ncbi:MAG: helix-turn-helix domain-containing protein [Mediterranea sp.]|jgi:AraC-like DNA-binding protein|nr:helix-turn-helix domain-containing protein [Mediterranea sp.]